MDTEWQDNVNIGLQYADHRQEILDRRAELQRMWDGCLSCIEMAKHGITLTTHWT